MKREALRMLSKALNQSEKRTKVMVTVLATTIKQKLYPRGSNGGRPPQDAQSVVAGIIYYTRTGCGWKALPAVFGKNETIYGWFRKIREAHLFEISWYSTVEILDQSRRLQKKNLLFDGSLTADKGGGSHARHHPKNAGKRTVKRMLLTDGKGLPLHVILVPGTSHDSNHALDLIDGLAAHISLPKNFCGHGDKGFDSSAIRWGISCRRGVACIPPRNHGYTVSYHPGKDKKRPTIEHAFSWINSFKAISNTFLKKIESIFQLTALACFIICARYLPLIKFKTLSESIL